MRTAQKLPAARLVLFCTVLSSSFLLAQAPPTPQPPKPTPRAAAPAPPPPPSQPRPTRATMAVLVTDRSGDPIEGVAVTVTGPAERDAKTDAGGNVLVRNMGEGTYRLRFEHPRFITLERELTMQAGKALRTTTALSPAPAREAAREKGATKEKEDREQAAPPPAPPQLPPPGSQSATFVSIPDVFESNPIGREPSRTSIVGCAGVTTTTLIQLRDPLPEHMHADADEAIYVVAGEGTQRIAGRDVELTAGMLTMVPRGTAHAITREGSRVLVLLSVVSGPPCTAR